MLLAVGALESECTLACEVFFAETVVVVLPDFEVDFFAVVFFFAEGVAEASAFFAAGVVAVPVVSVAASLTPGQSRQIKTAATLYKVILSRISSLSDFGSPPAPN